MGLKYYYNINDAPVYDILRQASIKTENKLIAFTSYSCQYRPDTGRIIEAYNIFYQGWPIDRGTYVPVPVAQPSS